MSSPAQRGAAFEAIPALLISIFVLMGGFQLALYMTGVYAADLAAFRASRILEENDHRDGGRNALGPARREADKICGWGYPKPLGSTVTSLGPGHYGTIVQLTARPFAGPDHDVLPSEIVVEYPIVRVHK